MHILLWLVPTYDDQACFQASPIFHCFICPGMSEQFWYLQSKLRRPGTIFHPNVKFLQLCAIKAFIVVGMKRGMHRLGYPFSSGIAWKYNVYTIRFSNVATRQLFWVCFCLFVCLFFVTQQICYIPEANKLMYHSCMINHVYSCDEWQIWLLSFYVTLSL